MLSPEDLLVIVGNRGGTNVGESLHRAAMRIGCRVHYFDAREAAGEGRIVRAASWRFAGRRPPFLRRFSRSVVERCAGLRPVAAIATGNAPLNQSAVEALRAMGIRCVNYSTDDPWNPGMRAGWHLRALPEYQVVFTTRQANIACLRRLGCRDVRYLPFGYDDELFRPVPPPHAAAPDVLFVGGADRDRIRFMSSFLRSGPRIALAGDYWQRYHDFRPYALGHQPPEALCRLTAAAKVNLCLVRRANRDGHVMRSFEIAGVGGCMLAEDTQEHRDIFGAEGEAVMYFRGPEEAACKAQALLSDDDTRARLALALRGRIAKGGHTYRHRLMTMLTVE